MSIPFMFDLSVRRDPWGHYHMNIRLPHGGNLMYNQVPKEYIFRLFAGMEGHSHLVKRIDNPNIPSGDWEITGICGTQMGRIMIEAYDSFQRGAIDIEKLIGVAMIIGKMRDCDGCL